MNYVLGIDSGGTHYRVLASDLEGNEIAAFEGRSAYHYWLTQEQVNEIVNENINNCLKKFDAKREDCKYIVCGTTGLDSEEDEAWLIELYNTLPGFKCPIHCINDAELAHYTVTGGTGVLVISGTGSIAFGRNAKNERKRAGGWPFSMLGDEGSGSWISQKAVRYLGRWYDGLVPKGPLVKALLKELGFTTRKDLLDLAVRMATPPWEKPNLSEIVNNAAQAGDKAAIQIITEAANETFRLITDIVTILKLEEEQASFKIGLWGSNILCSSLHLETVTNLIKKYYPMAEIVRPERSATKGAAALALELLTNNHQTI